MPLQTRGQLTFDTQSKTTHAVWGEFELTLPLRWEERAIERGIEVRGLDAPDQLIVRRAASSAAAMPAAMADLLKAGIKSVQRTSKRRAVMTDPATTTRDGVVHTLVFGASEPDNVQFALMQRGERGAILDMSLFRYTLRELPAPFERWAHMILVNAKPSQALLGVASRL